MSTPLAHQKCVPCEGGTAPLTNSEEDQYLSAVIDWQISREGVHQLSRVMTFPSFTAVVSFVNKIAEIAESEGHHPNLYIHSYKKLRVELFTHAINGLSMNDFILAAKIDEVWAETEKLV